MHLDASPWHDATWVAEQVTQFVDVHFQLYLQAGSMTNKRN